MEPHVSIAPHEKLLNCLERVPTRPSSIPQALCRWATFSALCKKANIDRHIDLWK